MKDAEKFSHKSHIIKHWLRDHKDIVEPPPFTFSVTGMFKDCLSRQIGEALRIFFSQDIILNSKSEYLDNCITRLTVEESQWERKEREKNEEIQEEFEKNEVERFREMVESRRMASKMIESIVSSLVDEACTSSDNVLDESSNKRVKHDHGIDSEHYTTPVISLYECSSRLDVATDSHEVVQVCGNRGGVVQEGDLQGGGVDGGVHVQVEGTSGSAVHEGDLQGGGIDGGAHGQGGSTTDPASAVGPVRRCTEQKRKYKQHPDRQNNYNLAWFTLWWKRMEREGERDKNKTVLEEGRRKGATAISAFLTKRKRTSSICKQ